ncbi:hypothetical protein HY523_00670, partial [Candidatus Berkelbacteria bacterium]|nr:hypothetical protein [Candidatus Berkelbacteria bacterium]
AVTSMIRGAQMKALRARGNGQTRGSQPPTEPPPEPAAPRIGLPTVRLDHEALVQWVTMATRQIPGIVDVHTGDFYGGSCSNFTMELGQPSGRRVDLTLSCSLGTKIVSLAATRETIMTVARLLDHEFVTFAQAYRFEPVNYVGYLKHEERGADESMNDAHDGQEEQVIGVLERTSLVTLPIPAIYARLAEAFGQIEDTIAMLEQRRQTSQTMIELVSIDEIRLRLEDLEREEPRRRANFQTVWDAHEAACQAEISDPEKQLDTLIAFQRANEEWQRYQRELAGWRAEVQRRETLGEKPVDDPGALLEMIRYLQGVQVSWQTLEPLMQAILEGRSLLAIVEDPGGSVSPKTPEGEEAPPVPPDRPPNPGGDDDADLPVWLTELRPILEPASARAWYPYDSLQALLSLAKRGDKPNRSYTGQWRIEIAFKGQGVNAYSVLCAIVTAKNLFEAKGRVYQMIANAFELTEITDVGISQIVHALVKRVMELCRITFADGIAIVAVTPTNALADRVVKNSLIWLGGLEKGLASPADGAQPDPAATETSTTPPATKVKSAAAASKQSQPARVKKKVVKAAKKAST